MLTKVIFCPVIMCTFVPWLTAARLMALDSNNGEGKKSHFRRGWEIKWGRRLTEMDTEQKESRRLM